MADHYVVGVAGVIASLFYNSLAYLLLWVMFVYKDGNGTATSLIKENGTVKGVHYKDKTSRLLTAYTPLIVAFSLTLGLAAQLNFKKGEVAAMAATKKLSSLFSLVCVFHANANTS
ncbi:hypothetical protein V6N12_053777 [Hibiscus sabdariffa]|uniref:Uncharacterized protein n=1 Tax=Hibiscus sabdariffa TaxID=183260 RepID=A0ABR2D8X3_9ROSI